MYSFVSNCYFKSSEKRGNVGLLLTTSSHCTLMADSVQWLSQSDYSICISRIVLKLDRNTKLARAVEVMFPFYSSRCFLKGIENMFSVFLSSYRNTRQSLGELEKAQPRSQGQMRDPGNEVGKSGGNTGLWSLGLPNFRTCFCNLIETQYIFSIS